MQVQIEVVLGNQRTEEVVGNLNKQGQVEEEVGVEEEEALHHRLHLLCWLERELEEVGNAVGSAAGEEACDGRTSQLRGEGAWRKAGRAPSVQVEAAAGGRLCSMGAAEVAGLHAHVEQVVGDLARAGWGGGAEGQSGLVEVEGSGRRNWSLAQEAGALACQEEGVGVQSLLCSPPV